MNEWIALIVGVIGALGAMAAIAAYVKNMVDCRRTARQWKQFRDVVLVGIPVLGLIWLLVNSKSD